MTMNARKKKSQQPLDKVLPDPPPDRISELEHRILQLEKDVATLKSLSGSPFFNEVVIQPVKKKRGRKPQIPNELLFSYRDGLILWLEPVWPWLAERLPLARTPAQLAAILEAVAEEPDRRPVFQQRLMNSAAVLLEFLLDEGYRKTELPKATVMDALAWPWEDEKCGRAANQLPSRRIANAMAGVPEIAWPTSRDRCSEAPLESPIALNMDLFYRDKYGIPALQEERVFFGMRTPVPKPCQPISAQASDQAAGRHRAAR